MISKTACRLCKESIYVSPNISNICSHCISLMELDNMNITRDKYRDILINNRFDYFQDQIENIVSNLEKLRVKLDYIIKYIQ